MKVVGYAGHGMTPWMRALLARLPNASSGTVVSEFRDGDVDIMERFYARRSTPPGQVVADLGQDAVADILRRCRFLRAQRPDRAMHLVNTMYLALSEILDAQAPDATMSFQVDYYALDLFERITRARGIPHICMTASPLSGYTMLTARGEHNEIRQPSDAEVDMAVDTVANPAFRPFLRDRPRYNAVAYAKRYAYWTARACAFDAIRIARRDGDNFYYNVSRQTSEGGRPRLRDFRVPRMVHTDWQDALDATPPGRRFFVPLGVHPESTIDYWVGNTDLIDYQAVTTEVVTAFSRAGYTTFVKDHPNMFVMRRRDLIERLTAIPGVVLVPYDVAAQTFIEACDATFAFGSTVGLQTAFAGKTPVVTHPYYFVDGQFVRLLERDQIPGLPDEVEAFTPPADRDAARRALVRQALSTTVPGDLMQSWNGFDTPGSPGDVALSLLVEGLAARYDTLARIR